MKKNSSRRQQKSQGPYLFTDWENRRRRVLILPRYLKEMADDNRQCGTPRDERLDRAFKSVKRWIELESEGRLHGKKETALDASFLLEIFGEALGHKSATQSPDNYHLERNFTVSGVGTADGALGEFPKNISSPVAVIELKGADADLDRDRFNGRTAVQQCWDYLNALPDCPWGIVSNFVTFRLYHRDKTPLAYQEFHLKDLGDIEKFRQFYCLFEFGGLFSQLGERPRALRLLEKTEERQQEVGDELYEIYSGNRYRLIEHLHFQRGLALDSAIRIAQKILDRIIFVAFCEDRSLLPEKSIAWAYHDLPRFKRVKNPRWHNFLALFHAIDQGDDSHPLLKHGYNGGLFRHDPEVDDLHLDDIPWTEFFKKIGDYDFRDEVNVEVLGHLFERSVGELEKLRLTGLRTPANGTPPAMPKSAERKRFGIYYTPPEFTQFIVQHTVAERIDQRFEQVRQAQGLKPEQLEAEGPSPILAQYWQGCAEAVRQIKICDPACGSGAFLIEAYDALEAQYVKIVKNLQRHDKAAADQLADVFPDMILADNLYGVDLSAQAVEITQLALWIRSARPGKTLADLSHNIVLGNSLVADPAVHPQALDWQTAFPKVFAPRSAGYDCVIGNPPWERLKLQEREFFAFASPKIANAVSAAQRRKLIAELEQTNPELFARYTEAKTAAERTLANVRESGRFPLTAKGDVNTYALFAELARTIVAPTGRVGLLVPSGIATDNTTKEFFADLMDAKALIGLYDFENRLRVFPDVDSRFKFCILLMGGSAVKTAQADFAFFAHRMEDLENKKKHIALSAKDLALLNPNTRTCPIFRTRRDADLTKAIYRRVPILIDDSRKDGGNPWGIKFVRMFDQTNDAEMFRPPDELKKEGFKLEGNRWIKGKRTFLPLYEAKMVQAYDHRAAGVVIVEGNWVRQGQTEAASLVEHQNPEFAVQPRWWADAEVIDAALGLPKPPSLLAFKDVTSPTNTRTVIAAFIPAVGVANSAPLMRFDDSTTPRQQCCLLANLNSFVLDYVARQKVGNLHLNFFIIEQFAMFPPDYYAQRCPWNKRQTLEKWLSERVLKLTCTANDMKPLAEEAGFEPLVHKWQPAERAELLAELDAAYFHLYGLDRDDAAYVLSTFAGMRDQENESGLTAGAGMILEAYDRLQGKDEG